MGGDVTARQLNQLSGFVDNLLCRRSLVVLDNVKEFGQDFLNLRVLTIADDITDRCPKLLSMLVDRALTFYGLVVFHEKDDRGFKNLHARSPLPSSPVPPKLELPNPRKDICSAKVMCKV